MKKQVKVGGMSLDIPDHDSRIGEVVQALQDAYERGEVRGLMVVRASDSGLQSQVAASALAMPAVALAANALSEQILENLCFHYAGGKEEDDE